MLSLLFLCAWTLWQPQSDKAPKILLLVMAILAFGPISDAFMGFESARFPLKFDYSLYLVDKSLGLSAFLLARLFTEWQRSILYVIYQSLVYVMIFWYGLSVIRNDSRSGTLLKAYAVTFLAGPCLYMIVPARGPRHAFGSIFPWGDPNVSPVLVRLGGWPNAIPSLHVATALLFLLFAGKNRILRYLAWIYLAGTVAATLAFEHYLIDLIVAVPFACFAALAARGRILSASGNLAVVLVWLVAIRFATPELLAHPALLRILAFATILFAVSSVRTHRKAHCSELRRPPSSTELDYATPVS